MKKFMIIFTLVFFFWINSFTEPAAMHIMEGFLPVWWTVFWWVVTIPFIIWGLKTLKTAIDKNPEAKLMIGFAGAFAFVLSALKIPSVTGSSSHPVGTALGTMLFGPAAMTVLGTIVLLFQALLLAHGGITTLGANAFSMAVAGPFAAYAVYRLLKKAGVKTGVNAFFTAFSANIVTYSVTSLQLALAFPSESGGVFASFLEFAGIFAVTQLSLAVCEGLLTAVAVNWLEKHRTSLKGVNFS
ncbi:energy-coupling factor ABC transporter permease [Domibacillus epiphyticus]|uniref:Cobalt transport protein CbiM n=1 Tax=Domibacillus epiphyticus TaxID=1714355 RepID=A0A1V2A6W8_9BACI|nr:energy-coupling factor ABC transporter permease [Domibacillus epiphyticus]OMP66739.1 cobalamin biosynthesis protein CbiM [Domibacillus epiphyticus]